MRRLLARSMIKLRFPIREPDFGDGCTWAPDSIGGVSIVHCCSQHDKEYELGGDPIFRRLADLGLRDCVRCTLKAASSRVANALADVAARGIYRAVRIFGRFFWDER